LELSELTVVLELSAMGCVLEVSAVELPALAELPGLGWELAALGWVLPPQSLEPAVPGFELPAPALLELPLPWLHHPAQPNTPLSTRLKTPQTPQLQ
jgi:hypothetical protein